MAAPNSETRPSSRFAVFALCLALVSSASMVYYHLDLFIPSVLQARAAKGLGNGYSFGDDFYPIWLVAALWRTERIDPYSAKMTHKIQTGLFGRPLDARNPTDPSEDYRQFAYPAFAELLLWPAAFVKFSTLRVVLVALLSFLTVASLWLWMRGLQWRIHPIEFAALTLLALCNYPILEALFAVQPGLIVGFLLAGAALALRQDRLLLAGTLMSLTLIKPQMTLLAIAYLVLWSLFNRGTRFVAGFIATTLLLVSASLWIWPHWIEQWLKVLLGYHRYATPPLVTVLPGAILGVYIGPASIVAMLGVSVWLAWQNRHASVESLRFWLTLSLLLAITSVTLLPGQAIYDHVILLPGIFLLIRCRSQLRGTGRIPRILLSIGTLVLFWPWVAAFVLVVVWPLLPHRIFESAAIFSLPIRTAASLPFAVVALLAYAMRITRLQSPAAA